MTQRSDDQARTRRHFLKLAGGSTLALAGTGLLPFNRLLGPAAMQSAEAAVTTNPAPDLFMAGTDGWISLPKNPALQSAYFGAQTHPDNFVPDAKFSTYIFGFRDVTGLTDAQRAGQKMKAQHNAPLFWLDEVDPANPKAKQFRVNLMNLGLAMRPDLFDAHTIHYHGFRNVLPIFDGEPQGSVAVTAGRVFQYVYRPRDPGTYMWHCHVEEIEHIHMGMTGPLFVRPKQNGTNYTWQGKTYDKFVYNDGDGSTGYDREFAMFMSEVWCDSHWADSHIELPEWSDYRADFCLLNGRVYPDTIAPNSLMNMPANAAVAKNLHSLPVQRDASGDLLSRPGHEHLQYQPMSALVECNAGDRVLLRFANLGFLESAMTLAGIRMTVVGKDATHMRGRPDNTNQRADTSYDASTLSFGPGESIDALFTAPAFSGGSGSSGQGYDVYLLFDRAYERTNNKAAGEGGLPYGGRQTEVRVYPAGTVQQQLLPNTNPHLNSDVY